MRHGAKILASKWRERVTPNGCRPFSRNGEVALPLPTPRAALVLWRAHGLLIDGLLIDVSFRAARDTD
jgi:hypothetical protein